MLVRTYAFLRFQTGFLGFISLKAIMECSNFYFLKKSINEIISSILRASRYGVIHRRVIMGNSGGDERAHP